MLRREMLKLFGLIPFLGLGANKPQEPKEQEAGEVKSSKGRGFVTHWHLNKAGDEITYKLFYSKILPLNIVYKFYQNYDNSFTSQPFKEVMNYVWKFNHFSWERQSYGSDSFRFVLTLKFISDIHKFDRSIIGVGDFYKGVFPGVCIPTREISSFDTLIKEIESNV
jgi:hypothetical protein